MVLTADANLAFASVTNQMLLLINAKVTEKEL